MLGALIGGRNNRVVPDCPHETARCSCMVGAVCCAADYGLTPRDRPKLFVLCTDAPRAALLEREAALVGTLASAEQVLTRVFVKCHIHAAGQL